MLEMVCWDLTFLVGACSIPLVWPWQNHVWDRLGLLITTTYHYWKLFTLNCMILLCVSVTYLKHYGSPLVTLIVRKKFISLFCDSIFVFRFYFLLSHYYEIAYLFPISNFFASHYFEIAYLFPVSKFLLSHYYEIAYLFPISNFLHLIILR